MGAAFGGASQQVFGGAGAGNFLTKLTEVCAFTFMFTSLLLAGLASQRGPSKYEEAAKVVYAGQVAVPQPTPLEMPLPIAPGTPSGAASGEPLVPAPGSAAPSAAPILPLIPAPSASH